MKVLIVSLIAFQLTFSNFAFAQMKSAGSIFPDTPTTSLATGTAALDPSTNPNFGNTPDPWGIPTNTPGTNWDPGSNWGTDPSVSNGSLYDPNTYNYSNMGGMGGYGMGYQSPASGLMFTFLGWMPFLYKDYKIEVTNLRAKYGYLNDAVIAEKIIAKATRTSAAISAASVVTSYVFSKIVDANTAAGSGMGGMMQVGIYGGSAVGDILQTFGYQGEMILTLAALYGQCPDAPDQRMGVVATSMAISLASGALIKKGQMATEKLIETQLSAMVSSAALKQLTETGLAAATATKVAQELVPALVAKGVAQDAADSLVAEFSTKEAAALAAIELAKKGIPVAQIGKTKKIAMYLAPIGVTALFAGVAYAINNYSSEFMGRMAQKEFIKDKAETLSTTINAVKNYSVARKTVWMILLKYIFPKIDDIKAKQKFAYIVNHAFPFNKAEKDLAFAELENDKDKKLIDKNLVAIHRRFGTTIEPKLYILKILLTAMYLNAEATNVELGSRERVTTLSNEFEQILDTVQIGLGVKIPAGAQTYNFAAGAANPSTTVALPNINPKDPRREFESLYNNMRGELEENIARKREIWAKQKNAESQTDVKSKSTGSSISSDILLEDYAAAASYKDLPKLLELATGGRSPEVNQLITDISKKATSYVNQQVKGTGESKSELQPEAPKAEPKKEAVKTDAPKAEIKKQSVKQPAKLQ